MKLCLRLLCIFSALSLAACATQPAVVGSNLPGFFTGVVHGLSMPLAFVGSIFLDIRVYAYPNDGWPYDLGYMSGAAMLGAAIFTPT